jgi:hypothetical protein
LGFFGFFLFSSENRPFTLQFQTSTKVKKHGVFKGWFRPTETQVNSRLDLDRLLTLFMVDVDTDQIIIVVRSICHDIS